MAENLNIVICGLSLSSSWGNGHATTYRHLSQGLCARGHHVQFLERDVPWYASNRDMDRPSHGQLSYYHSPRELFDSFGEDIRRADLVIVGSYVPDGIEIGRWIINHAEGMVAFYDIDTPITLDALENDACEYLARDQVPKYDFYLSFSGGGALEILRDRFGAPLAFPLYCSVDPEKYYPEDLHAEFDLGYMGTYSADRQLGLNRLMLEPAQQWTRGRFVVGGPQYPDSIQWPENVQRREHIPPDEHLDFYNSCRFTLNLTRDAMRRIGYSPSIRLFEAAACGAAIISDVWNGLDQFFDIGSEILTARGGDDTLKYLRRMSEAERRAVGANARTRVLAAHTGLHRAVELEQYVEIAAKNSGVAVD